MFYALHVALLATLLPVTVLGARNLASKVPFQLYAYGPRIGGLPLFFEKSADEAMIENTMLLTLTETDLAFAGNPSTAFPNDPNAAIVSFTMGDKNSWIASPIKKTTDWSNVTLFVPFETSEGTRIGFLPPNNGSNTTVKTTGFSFYGRTALCIEEDGTVDTLFTGLRLDNGAIQLFWNDTSAGKVPVTLRSTPPSSVPASHLVNAIET